MPTDFYRLPLLGGLAALIVSAVALGPGGARPGPAGDEWARPPALKAGDTIAFVAPAGPADAEKVGKAKERFERMGFRVAVPPTLTARRDRYLAGSDADRAAEFDAAVRDRGVHAVFAVKGGYGLTRILDRIDYRAVRENPKVIAGFSDLTALHLAIARKCRLVTFHAPMPQYGLWRDDGGFGYSGDLFWRAVRADRYPQGGGGYAVPLPADGPKPVCLVPGTARGRLVGGNLSLVAATVGTPFEIEPAGNILLLEDTGEKAYRIDRMLSQLRLAGLLDRFAGVVAGTFDGADGKELDAVLKEYFGRGKVPVVTNYPVGHTPYNATLPHGGLVEVDAAAGTVRLLEAPVVLE
jgi:muramoyltetrapeptide carboxypeptidase